LEKSAPSYGDFAENPRKKLLNYLQFLEIPCMLWLEESMTNKTLLTLLVALLLAAISTACAVLAHTPTPTPEPDPCCLSTPSGPLKFEPETLPAAQAGVLYEAEIHIMQNSTPISNFAVAAGSLPAGLELVKVEGADTLKISGAPQETGTFTFTIAVGCYGTMVAGQTGEKEYSLVVEQ
jgi:hypothetical protein